MSCGGDKPLNALTLSFRWMQFHFLNGFLHIDLISKGLFNCPNMCWCCDIMRGRMLCSCSTYKRGTSWANPATLITVVTFIWTVTGRRVSTYWTKTAAGWWLGSTARRVPDWCSGKWHHHNATAAASSSWYTKLRRRAREKGTHQVNMSKQLKNVFETHVWDYASHHLFVDLLTCVVFRCCGISFNQ